MPPILSEKILIRLYRSEDRQDVRKICGDTANRGDPVESFFHERELIVDLVTSYYTDYEPSSLWVAESGGKVVGYITGCLDQARYQKILKKEILPQAFFKALKLGVFFHSDTWRLLWSIVRTGLRGGFFRQIPLDKFPVHLHIDISNDFRGRGIGYQLMECFVKQVKDLGLSGIHAIVREDNTSGCKFFEKVGFRPLNRYPAFLPFGSIFRLGRVIVYARVV